MDTAILQTFRSVVDEGSFASAARRLGISRSLCSRHVAILEDHLGVRLLTRSTRALHPTASGCEYYRRVGAILDALQSATDDIRSLSVRPAGTLRIGTPTGYAISVLRPHMIRFMEDYPEIHLDAVLDDRVTDLIAEGLDAVIRIGALADSALIARHLHDISIEAVAARAYLDRRGEPGDPSDLVHHDCLYYTNLCGSGTWPFRVGKEITHQKIHPVFSSNNGEMIHAAAFAGHGIALIPGPLVRDDIAAGRLIRILSGHEMQDLPVNLIYPSRHHMSAALRAFIDFLAGVEWG